MISVSDFVVICFCCLQTHGGGHSLGVGASIALPHAWGRVFWEAENSFVPTAVSACELRPGLGVTVTLHGSRPAPRQSALREEEAGAAAEWRCGKEAGSRTKKEQSEVWEGG